MLAQTDQEAELRLLHSNRVPGIKRARCVAAVWLGLAAFQLRRVVEIHLEELTFSIACQCTAFVTIAYLMFFRLSGSDLRRPRADTEARVTPASAGVEAGVRRGVGHGMK